MKLKNLNAHFVKYPYLTTPIDNELVKTLPLKDFDKDGYEVPAPLERMFYEAEGVKLNYDIQYHVSPVTPWYIDTEDSERYLVLDHCMLLCRMGLAGEARAQVEKHANDRPILNKLLNIKPKWGIDFSLDYIDHNICMEVVHIEQDFFDYQEAEDARIRLEHIIETTDWLMGAKDLLECKEQWENLSSDDHSDFKARFFGWDRAFDNKKVFA